MSQFTLAAGRSVKSLRSHRLSFDHGEEFGDVGAPDRPVHYGLADAAKRLELGDLLRMRGGVHEIAPGPARLPTPEAKKLAGRAFLTPYFLALGEERLEVGAMDKDRPTIVDRPKALPKPVADSVAVQAKELCDLVRIAQIRLFDQIDPVPPSSRGLPLESGHRDSPAASRRDAVCHPPVDLSFNPADAALGDSHGEGKAAIADVCVQSTSTKASPCLDFIKANKNRLRLYLFGLHRFHPRSIEHGGKIV
jgi:hypothetical protein